MYSIIIHESWMVQRTTQWSIKFKMRKLEVNNRNVFSY
jgi:hypothetical protein